MKQLFENYQKIKNDLKFNYKSYPIHNILSLGIILIVYKKKTFQYKDLALLFLTRKIIIPTDKTTLFSIGSYGRMDYYEILNYVRNDITSNLLDLSKIKKTPKISIKNMYISITHIFNKHIGLSFSSKVSLVISMTHILNIIDDLEKNEPANIQQYCSFCSHLADESILNYFFLKNNITTSTLQHGIYFIFDNSPLDAISYENFHADKLLCWGQYTKDEYSKYGIHESKITVCGYPRKTNRLKPCNHTTTTKIFVLFARNQYNKNNLRLIEILKHLKEKYNIELEFKLHPSLDSKIYKQKAESLGFTMSEDKTIQDLLITQKYDLSISYNSTAYYDSYLNNCVSLRYKDADADNAINVLDDSFRTLEELISKVEFFKKEDTTQDFWIDVEKRLEYILGFDVNNYRKVLSTG